MLHRPRRSVVYRSGKDDDTDRKTFSDRAIDCVAILNQKGWYEARDAPVDCLEMVEHSMKSYSVLTEDKWYGESFDNVCGEILMPNGSKRSFKGYMAVGLDQDNRVVCVPPGTISEDASFRIIRYAVLHTTLFKKHAGKKRAEKLNSYAAKAMEAKTPKEFLQIAKDMVRDLGKALGKVFNLKVALSLIVSGMVLFVIGAHVINVKDYLLDREAIRVTDKGASFLDLEEGLKKKLKKMQDKFGTTFYNSEEQQNDMKGVIRDTFNRIPNGREFFQKHKVALFHEYLPLRTPLNVFSNEFTERVSHWWNNDSKILRGRLEELDKATLPTRSGLYYKMKIPKWLVDLADLVGNATRKRQTDMLDALTSLDLDGKLSSMHTWMKRNFPGYDFSTTIGQHIASAINSAVTYLLESAKFRVSMSAKTIEDMARDARDKSKN